MRRPDPAATLRVLKDFQRRTVDYVFRRMYLDQPPARRFLVADEVGLGKTLVARGIIALALDHLADRVSRINVVYVCTNAAIAQQNIRRLNVLDDAHTAIATRLTLLPAKLRGLRANRVNFISFTPGTTFDLKSKGGTAEERAVIYRIMAAALPRLGKGLLYLLQGDVGPERWRRWTEEWALTVDRDLAAAFNAEVAADRELFARVEEICRRLSRRGGNADPRDRAVQREVVGDLRRLLAHVCVAALEPDLVILDEFQRFKDLLDGESDAARLAQELMSFPGTRVLLLSATPYRMLSLDAEGEEESHYGDFRRTLEFLFDDAAEVQAVTDDLRRYRIALYGVGDGETAEIERVRDAVAQRLRSVMLRTERVGTTAERDAMVRDREIPARLEGGDLAQARLADVVGRTVGAGDVVEYWKSAPYLLNFMKEYELKRRLHLAREAPPEELLAALRDHSGHLLHRNQFARYRLIDPANARLRVLLSDTVGEGLWRLLWMPPSIPYLQPGGAYAEVPVATKALVFSSWNVVPDAIAALCSYEAERRMLSGGASLPRYQDLFRKRRGLLRFSIDSERRPLGMSALALLYPSIALASSVDPLQVALSHGEHGPIAPEVARESVKATVERLLRESGRWPTGTEGAEDQRWYWAALALLDRPVAARLRPWCESVDGWRSVGVGGEEDHGTGFAEHIRHFTDAWGDGLDLTRAPDDLLDVLADVALAGPATCALRALRRAAPSLAWTDRDLVHAAARIAGGFRSLFNQPEAMGLLRGEEDAAYWRLVLQHGIQGNLQAVLDEYLHVLRESLGLSDRPAAETAAGLAGAVSDALSINASRVDMDEVRVRGRSSHISMQTIRLRCRFALRFGEIRDDQDKAIVRTGTIQQAFNSPFRPFILATTSIGQEGLDFHPYCHAVYHWNLPSNPVDMEQREGRVHRYKGHAVRKNLAERFGLEGLSLGWRPGDDPWGLLFELGVRERAPGTSDLVPYWIYENGSARVERRVPMLPFSRERMQLASLKERLALYRLVFGQPRQEDLLAHLQRRSVENPAVLKSDRWRISLEPPP